MQIEEIKELLNDLIKLSDDLVIKQVYCELQKYKFTKELEDNYLLTRSSDESIILADLNITYLEGSFEVKEFQMIIFSSTFVEYNSFVRKLRLLCSSVQLNVELKQLIVP